MEKMRQVGIGNLALCEVTLSELYYGAFCSEKQVQNLAKIAKLRELIYVLPLEEEVSKYFGKIKADLRKQGKLIEDMDIFIAAIARTNDLVLVTDNERHFFRVEGLKLENWLKL
jgi:tRNA(fMet)-specific endonuclease VapC